MSNEAVVNHAAQNINNQRKAMLRDDWGGAEQMATEIPLAAGDDEGDCGDKGRGGNGGGLRREGQCVGDGHGGYAHL